MKKIQLTRKDLIEFVATMNFFSNQKLPFKFSYKLHKISEIVKPFMSAYLDAEREFLASHAEELKNEKSSAHKEYREFNELMMKEELELEFEPLTIKEIEGAFPDNSSNGLSPAHISALMLFVG